MVDGSSPAPGRCGRVPLVGLSSLLLRSKLDPHFENYRAHFVVFGVVGALAFVLGYAAGEAANRRGDARVLLALARLHGDRRLPRPSRHRDRGYSLHEEHAGFQVAISVGLLVSAVFALGSAFVDVRPGIAAVAVRRGAFCARSRSRAMVGWFVWTVLELPPLGDAGQRGRARQLPHGAGDRRDRRVRRQCRPLLGDLLRTPAISCRRR